jgi:hypothetical protein
MGRPWSQGRQTFPCDEADFVMNASHVQRAISPLCWDPADSGNPALSCQTSRSHGPRTRCKYTRADASGELPLVAVGLKDEVGLLKLIRTKDQLNLFAYPHHLARVFHPAWKRVRLHVEIKGKSCDYSHTCSCVRHAIHMIQTVKS